MRSLHLECDESQELLNSLRDDGVGVITRSEGETRTDNGWRKGKDLILIWGDKKGVMKPELMQVRILGIQFPEAGEIERMASVIVARR
jgi:hypothetical protein